MEENTNYLCKSFFKNNADLFMNNLDNEDKELESFKARVIPNRKLNSASREKNKISNRLSITTFSKDIKLENSQLIVSEIVNANSSVVPKRTSYLENSFFGSKNKSNFHENLKDAKERMLYERKLTTYLHQKPNIHKILKKYTTEISPIITEIHNVENFNDKNMIDTISNTNNLDFLKKKFNTYEKTQNQKKNNKQNEYFRIKRNEKFKKLQSLHDPKEDYSCDSDNQSLTEATLDNLYKESMNIQKRILEKKNDGVGKRLKQFIKLANISQ